MPAKKKLIDDAVVPDDVTLPAAPSGNRVVKAEDLAADAAFLDDEAPQPPLGDDPADMPEDMVTEEPGAGSPTDETSVRGGINALVTRLLGDADLTYETIVAVVKRAYPEAKTTARSVASTASVLRRKGTPVPMRRGPKA